jgi:hypothetical protein
VVVDAAIVGGPRDGAPALADAVVEVDTGATR